MDMKRRKELLAAYKLRCPEKGIIAYRAKKSGECYMGISGDTKADFNSNNFQLGINKHFNHDLQKLWNDCGRDGIEMVVLETLKYEDPSKNYDADLEEMYEKYLLKYPEAKKL